MSIHDSFFTAGFFFLGAFIGVLGMSFITGSIPIDLCCAAGSVVLFYIFNGTAFLLSKKKR